MISETTELGTMFYICLFPVSFFWFLYFSLGQLVLQDLEWCIGGKVVTISDLKEVLKAKTEEKDRQKGGEERCYHGESYYSWECPVKQQSVVNTNKQKSFKNSA